MITTVLFDLDGTLLPMDTDAFTKVYFGSLAEKFAPLGYTPDGLIKGIYSGIKAMTFNDGSKTNEEAFWDVFYQIYPESKNHKPVFDEYYEKDFVKTKVSCGFDPKAGEIVKMLKEKGKKVALATNPLFPAAATELRTEWAGLDRADFEIITTYENSGFCKPNLEYYRWLLDVLDEKPENCLMVGNDVNEDMCARHLGMKVFLLTDCVINTKNEDISALPQGGFEELEEFIKDI